MGKGPRAALVWALVWIALHATATAAKASDGYAIAPAPAWVLPIAFSTAKLSDMSRVRHGVHYLLADRQLRVENAGRADFLHSAYQIAGKAGLDGWSDISIGFDPSFQTVVLHKVSIIRNGKTIDQLGRARIDVYQREQDLEAQLYNGEKTIHVLLHDVRVGDIVEYSYLVSGENPALKGHFSSYLDMQWSLPVDRVYRRVDWRKTVRTLKYRPLRDPGDPAISKLGESRIFLWDRSDVPEVVQDKNAPRWYRAFAGVALSDAEGWDEVAERATRFFEGAMDSTPALRQAAQEIRRAHGRPEDQIAAALHLVQDSIRYVAISVGPGGYVPNPASMTLRRKYGDCKDKTVLLVSLLRLLGIEAYPALVNTEDGATLRDRLPAMPVFDHVITKVMVQGTAYWLDPTLTDQEGDLAHLYQPNYGAALVLSGSPAGLTDRPLEPFAAPTMQIFQEVDLTAGPGKPGSLTVRSVYTGPDADWMRRRLAQTTLAELQKQYLEYYDDWYDQPRAQGDLAVERADSENRIVVTERYVLARPWRKEDGRWKARYHTGELRSAFNELGSADRKSPFAVAYPVSRQEEVTIKYPRIPGGWETARETERIANPSFVFDYSYQTEGEIGTFRYGYRTLRDHVPMSDLAAYKADLDRAVEQTGSSTASYSDDDAPSGDKSKWYWVGGSVVVWLFAWALTRRQRGGAASRRIIHYHIDTNKI